mgnify:CR=1 FL=1
MYQKAGFRIIEDLPEHEGKLVFTITTDLGADGEQIEITNGKGTYYYQVPDTAKDGEGNDWKVSFRASYGRIYKKGSINNQV